MCCFGIFKSKHYCNKTNWNINKRHSQMTMHILWWLEFILPAAVLHYYTMKVSSKSIRISSLFHSGSYSPWFAPFGDGFETSWIDTWRNKRYVLVLTKIFPSNTGSNYIRKPNITSMMQARTDSRVTPTTTRSESVADFSVMVTIMRIISLLVIIFMPILNTYSNNAIVRSHVVHVES